jgi:hypothetical protein
MQTDTSGLSIDMDELNGGAAATNLQSSYAAVQAALASLNDQGAGPKPPRPGEIKWKLTTLVLPSVMLVFVALYVTSLTSGSEPEVALFRAGGVSVILAVLGRVAVSILGDDNRFVLNDSQIVAMAQSGPVRDHLGEHGLNSADQPYTTAHAAGAGGKG